MSYVPGSPPQGVTDQALRDWMERELTAIASALREIDGLKVPVLSVSPAKPRSGDVAYADSVNWNPGSGAGFYGYVGSSWRLM